MSIDFSFRLKGIPAEAQTVNEPRTQSASAYSGKAGAVSGKSSEASANEAVSSVKEDFKDWLEAETARITSEGGSATDVIKGVTESMGITTKTASTNTGITSGTGSVSELAEMKQLIDSLDNSILGNVADQLDSTEVAADLLGGGRRSDRVISQLVSGHLNSIVMSSLADSDNAKDDVKSGLTESLTDESTETLAQNLETLIAGLGQTIS